MLIQGVCALHIIFYFCSGKELKKMQKPSTPAGTRDFSPSEMAERNYIFDSIRDVFKLYGFVQIETPAMENLGTLLGKYGEEGDKLLYKILNSGDFLSKISPSEISSDNATKLSTKICEKGLRYDLTVPFARYVVQHLNDITFPFKRYQIQPVWRADRPQKGRYREFYQCDADIIGSNSLLNELELVNIIEEVFSRLNIPVELKINNRKILAGMAEMVGCQDKMMTLTIALDKLDKIGWKGVKQELIDVGINESSIDDLHSYLFAQKKGVLSLEDFNWKELRNLLKYWFEYSEIGKQGIDELEKIFKYTNDSPIFSVKPDLKLARGLNYYTGTIFEVSARNANIGSICGGGRYDDLTGIFGLKDVSGVGISFGADRIYDVMKEGKLFPQRIMETVQVLFINFGETEQEHCIKYIHDLRTKGIIAELYPDTAKLKKQMSYANNKHIPFVVLLGENEIKQNKLLLKNMSSGEQKLVAIDDIVAMFI